jgi:hypothetical protein
MTKLRSVMLCIPLALACDRLLGIHGTEAEHEEPGRESTAGNADGGTLAFGPPNGGTGPVVDPADASTGRGGDGWTSGAAGSKAGRPNVGAEGGAVSGAGGRAVDTSGAGGTRIVDEGGASGGPISALTGGVSGGGGADATIDGGAGAGGGAPADAWSPANLDGLVLWLDASDLFGDAISNWNDRSGYRHHAFQLDSANQPQLSNDALRGEPGIRFDGVDDFLVVSDAPALRLGKGPFVVELVFSHESNDSSVNPVLFSKQAADFPFPGPGIFGNRGIGVDTPTRRLAVQLDFVTAAFTPPNIAYNDGKPRILGLHRSSEFEFCLRVNGVMIDDNVSLGEPIDVSAPDTDLYLGGVLGTQALKGVLSEIVVARGASTEQVASLERYLMRKHAAALAAP